MDHESENGENFYSPTPPPEQVREEQAALDATKANIPLLEELVADFEKLWDEARSIVGMKVGDGINTDAKLLAKGEIEEFAKKHLDKYKNLLTSVLPTEDTK